MQVEITPEETAVLIRWKKRADNYVLVRMKAEAILYASRGVDVSIIAEIGRAQRENHPGVAGRLAGQQDVLGADRARREPERGETHPCPEGRPQGRLGPAALTVRD